MTGRNDFKRNAGVWDKDSLLKWHTLAQFTSRDGRDESNLICDFVVGTDGLISTLVSQPISLKMEEKKNSCIYLFHDSSKLLIVRRFWEMNCFTDFSGNIFIQCWASFSVYFPSACSFGVF